MNGFNETAVVAVILDALLFCGSSLTFSLLLCCLTFKQIPILIYKNGVLAKVSCVVFVATRTGAAWCKSVMECPGVFSVAG